MAELANTSTTVVFNKDVETVGLHLELDDVRNKDKTSFAPGDVVYIRVSPGGLSPSSNSTMGIITKMSVNIVRRVPKEGYEYLIFARDIEKDFSYLCTELVDLQWCGFIPEISPRFDELKVSFSDPVSCVMKVQFNTSYDLWRLSGVNIPCKVLVEAFTEDRYGSLVIDFAPTVEDEEKIQKSHTYLSVRDACTQQTIPGAIVVIEGVEHIADSNGRVDLGIMETGTYPIKITAEDYQDSDKDRIGNDQLVIG